MTSLDGILESLERHFVAMADAERATPMAAYMRDQFPFYGIGATDRRDIHRAVFAERPLPVEDEAVERFVAACLARSEREWHYTAVAALRRHGRRLGAASWPAVHRVATTHPWWDTIDELAKHVAGRIVANDPSQVSVMDDWVRHDEMWVARVAILHQLGFKEATDPQRLFDYCLTRAEESDFFFRKAIGWALRQYAYVDGPAVATFVEQHRGALSALTIREATKNL